MSRKTKIALRAGTKLDFDEENHQRHIMDEAFDGHDERPSRPTMTPPERSGFWWFWRFVAFFIRMPARRLWRKFSHWDLREGGWRARYSLYPKIKNWLDHGGATPIKRCIRWLVEANYCCPTCGFEDYSEEIILYDHPDEPDGREVNMFEYVDGGGLDYWGEAEDSRGWLWCWRCGDVNWEST